MVDRINEYAEKWLNVSADIRKYLEKNTTEHNLESIREVNKTMVLSDSAEQCAKSVSQQGLADWVKCYFLTFTWRVWTYNQFPMC